MIPKMETELGQFILDMLPVVADGTWRVTPWGDIRNQRGECPICAVINCLEEDFKYTEAAHNAASYFFGDISFGETIDLDYIEYAADDLVENYPIIANIRSYLLEVLL